MTGGAVVEQLMAARQELDRACDLLTKPSPQAMDACTAVLEAAGRQLAEWQPSFSQQAGNPVALEEAWRLKRSVTRAGRLLKGAGDFHLNWLRLRGAMTGGYTETGESAPLLHGHSICVQG
jgi:hypothetical protein